MACHIYYTHAPLILDVKTYYIGDYPCALLEQLVIYHMPGNNTTMKIDFTDLTEKMKSRAQSF